MTFGPRIVKVAAVEKDLNLVKASAFLFKPLIFASSCIVYTIVSYKLVSNSILYSLKRNYMVLKKVS